MSNPKSKVQPGLLRQMNERRILEVIQTRGPVSRAEVRRFSGISAPTVSKTVAALLDAKLLEETEVEPTAPGRPSKILQLARESVQVLGIVVGTKRCWVLSAGLDGKLHDDRMIQIPTPGTYQGLLELLVEKSQELIKRVSVPTLGIGISIPGLLHQPDQRTLFSPNLHQTDGQTLGKDLEDRLELETVMLQEAYALCLAEKTYGEAKGLQDFAMIDAYEGLGLGVFCGGQYIEGHSGLATELGHVTINPRGKLCGCGNHGCLETEATDAVLAGALMGDSQSKLDIDAVVKQLINGDLQPTPELQDGIEYMAIGAAMVINLYNPSHLFIFSQFLSSHDGLFNQFLELTRRRALTPNVADCEITRARGSKRQGAIAGIIYHLTSARGPVLDSES